MENWRGVVKEDSQGNMKRILGFPPDIARIFQKLFGKNSFLVAKWATDHYGKGLEKAGNFTRTDIFDNIEIKKFLESLRELPCCDPRYEKFYNYNHPKWKNQKFVEVHDIEFLGERIAFTDEEIDNIIEDIEKRMIGDLSYVLNSEFIQAIIDGKLTDLGPYKNLEYSEAKEKFYERTQLPNFDVLKKYPNGYKWVDTKSKKCRAVGKKMKNCGSLGVMTLEENASMILLYDKVNNPKVIATWEPESKTLKGIQGQSGTPPKEKYLPLIRDIIEILGATRVKASGVTRHSYGEENTDLPWNIVQLMLQPQWASDSSFVGPFPSRAKLTSAYSVLTIDGEEYITNGHLLGKDDKYIRVVPYREEYEKMPSREFHKLFSDNSEDFHL